MGFLTKEELLKPKQFKVKKVHLNKADFVYVREMSAKAKGELEMWLMEPKVDPKGKVTFQQTMEQYRLKTLVFTLCDEEGNLLFERGDYLALGEAHTMEDIDKMMAASDELNSPDREKIEKN
jgi:hypothetical protein